MPPQDLQSPPAPHSPTKQYSLEEAEPPLRVSVTPAAIEKCYLSVVVPAYNEEDRLPATLSRLD